MSVIFVLIPLSIVIAAGFLGAFIWAVRAGQYDDTCTPSMRVLLEDAVVLPRREGDVATARPQPKRTANDEDLLTSADISQIPTNHER